jgi:hypothetical protein
LGPSTTGTTAEICDVRTAIADGVGAGTVVVVVVMVAVGVVVVVVVPPPHAESEVQRAVYAAPTAEHVVAPVKALVSMLHWFA